ncbi:LON peptidase substrate-binding domain-containing protein [Dongia deserti]|uniref:LON peptidase substrate-binding domain-containing protein n=1 Tax=Dongia deserti TaxID=2268030 RepID=UPI000E64DF6B|nr:LON peptidase substrate-binding domain-containing protein [Dongia deserti]
MRPGPTSLGPFDPGYRELPEVLPIFPLTGAVVIPGGRLPLNIFEQRYLAMTRHALMSPTRLIGMVQPVEPGADRNLDPDARPAVHRIGCAGRLVSFQETEDGRYVITLSGLIRFAIKRELPLHAGGFRLVEPDYVPFAEDMAERDFEMAAKREFLAAFKSYVEAKQLKVDWDTIKGAPDDHLLVSLAMLSPFSPDEKQSLLECADLAQLGAMMTALFELAGTNKQSSDRILH